VKKVDLNLSCTHTAMSEFEFDADMYVNQILLIIGITHWC